MARTRVPAQPANAERNPITVLVTLALLAAVAIVSGLASPVVRAAAAAPMPRHVAVVVAGIGSACLDWKSGFTTAQALARVAEPTVKKDRIVQLNGRPSTAKKHPDGQWAYWRVVDGKWQRMSSTSTDSELAAGGTDGWTYSTKGAASAKAPAQSATKTYSSLCAASDKAAGPTQGDGGNGIAIVLSPSNPAPPKASGHSAGKPSGASKSKSSSKSKSKSKSSPKSSSKSGVSSSTGPSGADESALPSYSLPTSGAADPGDPADPSASSSKSAAAEKSGVVSPAASPVASDKDAGGPGLGLATGALLVLLVGGGAALFVVRRRLTGGAKS